LHSVGHCAQYCTYTTIEQESRDIVHIVSLDKRETNRNSVIMEKECFVRTMDALLPEIHISEVVTDAHSQISALLKPDGKYKQWGLHHSLDIWHAAKNLGKKLRRAGVIKDQSEILPWIKDIVNHFWYCAKQASSVEEFKVKKDYSYIPDLQRAIVAKRLQSGVGLPRKQTLRPDEPRRLGLLAPVPPPPTAELVRAHVTRGERVPQS
ncbi:hypothetical protein PO909_029940, partial [Leuciscus waleckii]